MALAVPLGHRLAQEPSVDFADVAAESFVSLHRGSAIHGFMDNIAGDLGVGLHVRIKVSGFESLCRMVEAGVGIGILPESVAARLRVSHRIAIVSLSDPWAVRELKICTQKIEDLPAFARDLVDHLVRHAAGTQ